MPEAVKRKVIKKQPEPANEPFAVVVRHFFSSTLWGVLGGVIIITALYLSIVRSPELSVQRIHVQGNQILSSFEIARQAYVYAKRFPEVVVPYPHRILQSSQAIETHLENMYPEIADVDAYYRGFNDLYIAIDEQEARIVHCNTTPEDGTECWQRSINGRPLLKTPQNDFDVNPKLNTSLYMTNNILPATLAEEVVTLYRLFSDSQHRIASCTYNHQNPDYTCLMSTRLGMVSLYVDTPSVKRIEGSKESIIDIVLKSIPPEVAAISYIDLRFYPKIVYK